MTEGEKLRNFDGDVYSFMLLLYQIYGEKALEINHMYDMSISPHAQAFRYTQIVQGQLHHSTNQTILTEILPQFIREISARNAAVRDFIEIFDKWSVILYIKTNFLLSSHIMLKDFFKFENQLYQNINLLISVFQQSSNIGALQQILKLILKVPFKIYDCQKRWKKIESQGLGQISLCKNSYIGSIVQILDVVMIKILEHHTKLQQRIHILQNITKTMNFEACFLVHVPLKSNEIQGLGNMKLSCNSFIVSKENNEILIGRIIWDIA